MRIDEISVSLIKNIAPKYPKALSLYQPSKLYPELKRLSFFTISSEPNEIYDAVRSCLYLMGLDSKKFGTDKWNPLGDLVKNGDTVVIKPNMVRHFNEDPSGNVESVVTHWSVIRPLIDYSLLAIGKYGKVIIADAAQHDCDIDLLKSQFCVDELLEYYRNFGYDVNFYDLRKEVVELKESVITKRFRLPGDPNGSICINLGNLSEFTDSQINPKRLRGSNYDDIETAFHHSAGRHEYLISRTVISSSLVINVPKLKTHRLIGFTAAMKNLIGINADKNWLPHWRVGFKNDGGDQFQYKTIRNILRYWIFLMLRPLLRQGGVFIKLAYWGAMAAHLLGLRKQFGGGAWIGNDTIWRTTLDLNKILFYSDSEGKILKNPYDVNGH